MEHEFDHAGLCRDITNAGYFRQGQDEKGEKGIDNKGLEREGNTKN